MGAVASKRMVSWLWLLCALAVTLAMADTNIDVGNFRVNLTSTGVLSVTHSADGYSRAVMKGSSPLLSASMVQTDWHMLDGAFSRTEKITATCDVLSQMKLSQSSLSATLCNVSVALKFKQMSENQLGVQAALVDPLGKYNRLSLHTYSAADEVILGLGEQYTQFNLKNSTILAMSTEQGVGRGLQPITAFLNRAHQGAGGDFQTTYSAVGHYVTSNMQSLMLTSSEPALFEFGDQVNTVTAFSPQFNLTIFKGDTPLQLIQEATSITGRQQPLPRWLTSGAVLGLEGGRNVVTQVLSKIRAQAPTMPISALWLQDWTGERNFSNRVGLWWNWEVDSSYYGWVEWIQSLKQQGIQMMTYINPMLTDVHAHGKASFRRNMFQEAKTLGYLVTDEQGAISMPYGSGLLDLHRSEVRVWTKNLIKTQMLAAGVLGFMCDFGEAFPIDAAGVDGLALHNQYPTLWARTAREAIQEAGLEGEAIFFSRSRGVHGPKYSPLYWNGDQLPTFDTKDGLQSSVTGMLSSGLSGSAFMHSDIGGYPAVRVPGIIKYERNAELLARWCEVAAFTAVYRTHLGTLPTSLQVYSTNDTLAQFSKFAIVYAAWAPLREHLMIEASLTGVPLARAMMIHFGDQAEAWTISDQWMLGPHLLIAPVMTAGATVKDVWLPESKQRWRHLWTGKMYKGGQHVAVHADIGEPPVFTQNSVFVDLFLAELKLRGVL